jgi:hypothetical protein
VDKINLLSKFVYPENFGNSVKNRFLEVAFSAGNCLTLMIQGFQLYCSQYNSRDNLLNDLGSF